MSSMIRPQDFPIFQKAGLSLKVTFSSVTIWTAMREILYFSYREFFEVPFAMGGEDIRGGKGGGFGCFQLSPGALRAGGDAQCRLEK